MSERKDTLASVDALLKDAYTGGFDIPDPRKTRDPLCMEWKRLGGFGALRGERDWVDCSTCHRKDGTLRKKYQATVCECPHGEHHEHFGMECRKCRGMGGFPTGPWRVRPTRDKAVRKRLKAILKKAGESRLMVFESGGIAGALNAAIPLYAALARKKK